MPSGGEDLLRFWSLNITIAYQRHRPGLTHPPAAAQDSALMELQTASGLVTTAISAALKRELDSQLDGRMHLPHRDL